MSKPDTPLEQISYYLNIVDRHIKQSNIESIVRDSISSATAIANELPNYLDVINNDENVLLKYIRDFSLKTDWQKLYQEGKTKALLTPEMIVDSTQARFLSFLQNLMGAKKILEIGMFTGYTTLSLALTADEHTHITAIEREPYLATFVEEAALRYELNNKISILTGDALTILETLTGPFDFIFLDADKASYLNYFQMILNQRLLSANGLLCIDNTLMKGSVYTDYVKHNDAEMIKTFNQYVKMDQRVVQVLLPLRDGVTFVKWNNSKL